MVSLEDKILVAQNCREYEPKNYVKIINNSYISGSCDDCENYIDGVCNKKLFQEIESIVKIN